MSQVSKKYKASATAISQYLKSKGFSKSERIASRVRGRSAGFRCYSTHRDGGALVRWESSSMLTSNEVRCQRLARLMPHLIERFGEDRVTFDEERAAIRISATEVER